MPSSRYRRGIDDSQNAKNTLRRTIVRSRRLMPVPDRERQNAAITEHVLAEAAQLTTIAAYVPVGAEPGDLAALDELVRQGTRVLLPIARNDDKSNALPLTWAPYRPHQLVQAPFGLQEPKPDAAAGASLAEAELVLVPALAVDRRGHRLGRGAGFYDRSLADASRSARLVAVLYRGEILDTIPVDEHDVPVTDAVTPDGLVTLRPSTWRG